MGSERSRLTLSPVWVQAAIITFVIGFGILGFLAIRVYRDHAPVPGRIVTESGEVIVTGDEIRAGQELFLTYGLMPYGSVYSHGAYLGPDFTADYLHRQALEMRRLYGNDERVRAELQANLYDARTDTLTWTEGQVAAFAVLRRYYEDNVLTRVTSGGGLGPYAVR